MDKKKRIIMLCGKALSGKDTSSNYITSNYKYERVAFADELKIQCFKVAYSCFGMNVELNDFYDQELKIKRHEIIHGVFVSPRDILQKYSTEFVRKCIDDNYWIKKAIVTICEIFDEDKDYDGIVISDGRYPNEIEQIKEFCELNNIEFIAVNIVRPGIVMIGDTSHSSETALDTYFEDKEYPVVLNTGTLDDLYKQIEIIIQCKDGSI